MSVVINPRHAAGCGYTTVIYRPDNDIAGLRTLSQPFSKFVVHAFPFASIAEIARLDILKTAGSYLLYNRRLAKAYVGESGNVANRLPDHIRDPEKNYATTVFVITTTDGSHKKEHAEFGQRYYYDAAEAADLVTLTNERRPHSVNLDPEEADPLIRSLSNVFLQLFDAGCRAFHDCVAPKPAIAAAGTGWAGIEVFAADEDNGRDEMLIGHEVTTVPLGVEESELDYQGLWARGYWYSKDRFVVAAGSEVRVATNKVIPGIVKKRNTLEASGVLAPIAGVTDRKRLLVPIMLRSDANAAEVCSGAHIDSSAWRQLARNLPLVIDL
jgi:hypothetical protein